MIPYGLYRNRDVSTVHSRPCFILTIATSSFGSRKRPYAEMKDILFGSSYGHPVPVCFANRTIIYDTDRPFFIYCPVAETAFMPLRITHTAAFYLIIHAQ